MIFDGLDSEIIDGLEIEGGVADILLEEETAERDTILIKFREEFTEQYE